MRAIATIDDAPFLSAAQKHDLLFNNAACFLRLPATSISRMEAGR